MDFELSPAQGRLLGKLKTLMPEGLPLPETSYRVIDLDLFAGLRDGGFFDLVREGSRSAVLDTALVTEDITRRAGIVPIAVHGLVVPMLFDRDPGVVVAIQDTPDAGPFRFAGDAEILIRYEADEAKAYRISPADAVAVKSNYVYPFAIPGQVQGNAIATAPAAAVRRRQRIGIAAECVGAMDALLTQLVGYLSTREQFGRKLGSFQALHHRLAELSVLLEGSRWLSREAAWLDEDEAAAVAVTYCTKAARRLCWESHELTGARGFSVDFGMYQHTLHLQALSVEAGGIQTHADDAAQIRWLAASPTPSSERKTDA
jgi:Acyl-CoA dehydrogenase, C-terminal domain